MIDFKSLPSNVILSIVDKNLVRLQAQLESKRIELKVDAAVKRWLAEHGTDKKMGARPMARLIDERLKKPLVDEILFGDLNKGGVVEFKLRKKSGTKDKAVPVFSIKQTNKRVRKKKPSVKVN